MAWVGGIILGLGLIATCAHYLPDYGRCLKGHEEPRHQESWTEMRQMDCGQDCHYVIPIYHPSEDYKVWVCDQYEFPDGDGKEQRRLRKER